MEGFGALALALVLVFLPRVAFASLASDQYGEPVYGPVEYDWQGEHYTNVAYIAANKYDAAAYACGYSKSEVGQWDLTVRAKLSNESTARAFYELANGFYAPVADDFVYTDYGPAPGFWSWAYSIYGEGNIWYHDGYTDTQVNAAKAEVESILAGDDGGVGSPDDSVTGQDSNYVYVDAELTGSAQSYMGMDIVGYAFPTSKWSQVVSGIEDSSMLYLVFGGARGAQTGLYSSEKVDIQPSYSSSTMFDYHGTYRSYSSAGAMQIYNNKMYMVVDVNVAYDSTKVDDYTLTAPVAAARTVYMYAWIGEADNELPDNNWPETDDPDVPTPPNPDAPTGGGNYVAPTLPKPTSPTQPTNVTVTVVTPVDDILDALNKIIEELENHCVHLQNKMVECARYIGGLTEQTRDAVIDAINESMSNDVSLHDELMAYLEDLFQWLRDNMNYNVEVTNTVNNDDVIDWLKRIYIQDGTGYSNTKPIDITQDYNGFGVWVDNLLGYVLPDLTDTNLAPVTSAFDALDDKFPFSVPGDVLRIFQSLDRSPVTPVVAVTIPSVLGIPAYTYSFDLSPYDTTMQTIRTIELMAFVVFLLVWARRAFNAEAGGASD